MAFTKKYLNEMFGTVLVLSALLSTVSAVDCHGKSFHCVNSTHFMICVDLGGGVSQAIENFLVGCPPPTVCQSNNHFECEFPAATIPSTTLSNVISEFTQPWEEVVTVSSTGNTTKEFSENYMITERITTTTEYSVNTDTTVGMTTGTESELYVNNKLNIPETVPTLAEIATSAIETTQTLNENMNITEYVPPEVTVEITTAVLETVIQTTSESRNITETGPVIVDDITKPVAEPTTENIIITDTVAAETGYKQRPEPIDTEQVPQTIRENLNVKGTEPTVAIDITTTIIETVTQSTAESGILTDTEHVIIDEFTATTTETTTDNIIITDPLGTELGYFESTATKQITLTTNDKLLELETVQSKTKPPEVTILLQHESATTNILLKEPPKMQYENPLNTEKPISSTSNNIPANNLHKVSISKTKNASKTDSFIQNILPVQTTDTLETIIKTATGSSLTTIPVDRVTEDLITAPSLDTTIKNSESVNVTGPSKPASSFVRRLWSNSSLVGNKQSAGKKIENTETQMPTINDPKTPYNSVTTRNRTEKVANITEDRDVGWNINSATLAVKVPTDVAHDHDAKENNLYRTPNKSLNENKHSTVNNAAIEKTLIITTYTHNPEEATILDETWTETIDNGATTKQSMTINEGSITTDTIQNPVTEYIIVPTRQAINLEILTTDLEPTTDSDIQSIPPAFEDNMNIDPQLPVNKNIISTVNNRDSTNGSITVESVNKDTVTTEAVDIPTTISNAQPVTPLEDNMMIETSQPVTEEILSTVNHEGSTNIFIAAQAVNMDTITTEALDISTTVSNAHTTPPTFGDNMKIEISLPVTENIVSTVNNGGSTNGFMTAQAVNMDTITTNAVGIPTAISDTQSMLLAVKDSIKTEASLGYALETTTENIVLKENNEFDKNGSINGQASDLNTISTDAIYLPTTVTNGQTLAFIDIMKTEDPLPTTENIVSLINNGDNTNGFMASQSINVHEVNTINDGSLTTDTIQNFVTDYIVVPTRQAVNLEILTKDLEPTTVSDIQSIPPAFEDNMNIDPQLPVNKNIISTVNNRDSTNGSITVESVNKDTVTTEAVDIPTTISNAQPVTPLEDNMMIETSQPVTEEILSTVNHEGSTNIFIAAQAVNMDTITTEALDIPTTVSNAHTTPPTFGDNMKIEISLPVTENIVSTVNNGGSTNGFMTAQAVNMDTITTNAVGIPTAISDTQSMLLAVKDSIKTEASLGYALETTTENIVLKENNEFDKNGSINGQASDLNTISTDAIYLPTTVTNGQTLAFIDIMKTEDPLPTTENIVSLINNGDNTNGFMASQSINVHEVNTINDGSLTTDTIQNFVTDYIVVPTRQAVNLEILTKDLEPTTVSDIQSIPSAFEDNMNNDAKLPVNKNIISTVNNRNSTNGFMTVESVNKDTITTEIVDIPIETSLPVTQDILSKVNNEGSTHIFIEAQAVNMDTITTEALDIPTTVSNAPTTPPTFEDNTKIEISLPVTENIVSTVNNGVSTNGFRTAQAVNIDTITTDAVGIPTTISTAQPVTPFEDNVMIETSLPVTEDILSTVNNEERTNIFIAAQAVNMDTITTEALDIPTTVSDAHTTPLTFEDNMKIEISLPVTENIVSTVNNGVSTNGFMTAQAVNMNTITTDALGIPTAISDTQSMLPAVKNSIKTEALFGNARATTTENTTLNENNEVDKNDSINGQASDLNTISTDAIYLPTIVTNGQTLAFINIIKTEDPLATTENIVSSIKNGHNTNGFLTSQSINVDEVNTEVMYGTYNTISNAQLMRPTFEDDITTYTLLTTTGNILSSVNYGVSTNDFTTAQPVSVDKVNTEPTHISTTTPKAPTIEDNMTVDVQLPATENILSSVNNGASTKGFMTTPPVNVDMINTKATIDKAPAMAPSFDDSTSTEPARSATKNIVSAINNGVTTNDLTTRKAGLETVVQLTTETYTGPSSKVIELSLDNENAVETVHGDKITAESGTLIPEIIKGRPNNAIQNIHTIVYSLANTAVDNAATSQKEASPINDNITRATTGTSIPTFGFDSAFDISNQKLINPQVESKTTQVNNNFQSSATERSEKADNINWNPLANQVFNNLNQNSDSIGTSVTNTNAEGNYRDATSLGIEIITTQNSTRVRGSKESLTTNGYSANIAKIKSGHETDNQSNSQSDIPVTISFNQKTDKLATVGVGISSVSTTLPANTSLADTTILDSLNPHEAIHNSSSSSSRSSVVDTYKTVRKPGSNAEVFLDHKDKINAKGNQDPSIISTSIKSDNLLEVKSSVIIDSPTVLHNNEIKLPTSSYGFSETIVVRTPVKGNKINEERRDDMLSKPVTLDVLPLLIHNIQLIAPATNIPAIMDFVPKSQAKNTVIITESYKSATTKPTFDETKIQNSVKVSTVPKIVNPAFNFQIGVSDKTGDTTTFPAVGSSTSNSQRSVFAQTVARNGDATFNLQTKFIDEAIVLSQPSHVEKILNKKTSAPNNAHVIPDTKPGRSGTDAGYPHTIHTPTTSYNVNTEIIAPETVSNYDSQKSLNLTPQEIDSSGLYQNSNSTVVTDLKSASKNISSSTKKAPQKSIGSDKIQSEVTHQNISSTNITSSLSTQTQNISTSTSRTPSQMVTPNTISQVNDNRNKQVPTDAAQTFACINGARGRYSDKDDCRKFYICIGNNEPIVGYCPEPSVFSDLKKLCTKNMSHCIRENQFKCPSAGRFSDFTKDNVYYICINHKTKLYRFKFQCQKGYILDKTTVHCIETKEIESNESVSISSSDNSSQIRSSSISSSTSSKSTSSKSNNSRKLDNSSSNNDNSLKSKKSNEAVETTEKSEGDDDDDDDDDDEVFKCKKEGKFPIRNECRRYYLCKKNRKSEYRRKIKKCNSGKVFHKDKKKCVDDDSYEC